MHHDKKDFKVSVIIRAYNEEKHIGKLISLIHLQSRKVDEIIVVDSGSEDKTVPIAAALGARIIQIKKSEFTFGRALNIGCEAAHGDILVFASAHVYPKDECWIEKLVDKFDNNVSLVYGRQIGDQSTHWSEHQIFASWFPDRDIINQKHGFCNNANCAILKTTWEGIRYDEYLTGLEDLKMGNEIIKSGRYISYSAEAAIVHIHEESPLKVRHRYQREAIAFRHIFPQSHLSMLDVAKFFLVGVYKDVLSSIRSVGCASALTKIYPILWFRFNQYLGSYIGYRHKGAVNDHLKMIFYYPSENARAVELANQDLYV